MEKKIIFTGSAGEQNNGSSIKARDFASSVLNRHRKPSRGISSGRCMWPFLPSGADASIGQGKLLRGSVAVYRSGSIMKAHRIVGFFSEGIYTRPDRPGAPIERVFLKDISGIWESGAGWRTLFLKPVAGSLLASMGIVLSRPGPHGFLKKIYTSLPLLPVKKPEAAVFRENARELSRSLCSAGLNPIVSSLEDLAYRYLDSGRGFAVIAKEGKKTVGAALLRIHGSSDQDLCNSFKDLDYLNGNNCGSREYSLCHSGKCPDEFPSAYIRLSVKRFRRHPDITDKILKEVFTEARRRGIVTLYARAPICGEKGDLSDSSLTQRDLKKHGFEAVDGMNIRNPATGKDLALFKKTSSFF